MTALLAALALTLYVCGLIVGTVFATILLTITTSLDSAFGYASGPNRIDVAVYALVVLLWPLTLLAGLIAWVAVLLWPKLLRRH